MDRIDKSLFILSFLPLADMVSTYISLSRGGEEVGILAKPIYAKYGQLGLIFFSSFWFLMCLVYVWLLKIRKEKVRQGQPSKSQLAFLVIVIYLSFAIEASWIGVIVINLTRPPSLLEGLAIWFGVFLACFVAINFFTLREMTQLIRKGKERVEEFKSL